ncbi:MAG: hypothetical protein JSS96_05135 [Bacteroidetes bacterium]|nr:hypothetical protein [Bacteroidota bacterium]
MNFTPEELEIIDAVKYRPSISIILSATAEIAMEKEMRHKLKITADNVKRQLQEQYPAEECASIMEKLDGTIDTIDYNKGFKSIAIYVSPMLAKIFYLPIPIEDKIIIDQSFEIRDLIYAKQEAIKFIVLLITGKHTEAYILDNGNTAKLKLEIPENIAAYDRDLPEQVANFTDQSKDKEILQNKYLKHIDNALSGILRTNNLPVFVLGAERMLGHFASITANTNSIAAMIHGNYEEASATEIQHLLDPYIKAWKTEKNQQMLEEIDQAIKNKKLEAGVKAIWTAAKEKNCSLLIVEKNYMYPADYTGDEKYIQKHDSAGTSILNMKDAVDDIIEQVIQAGGEVRFVDEGLLKEYLHIVLVRYY